MSISQDWLDARRYRALRAQQAVDPRELDKSIDRQNGSGRMPIDVDGEFSRVSEPGQPPTDSHIAAGT